MELTSFMRAIVEELDAAEIPYMITGSVATLFYGAARATYDIDIVIETDEAKLKSLVEKFQDIALAEWAPAKDALRRRSMFNFICYETSEKADFIIRKESEYDHTAFERRQRRDWFGTQVYVVSAEDSILSKLRWSAATHSELQLRDIVITMAAQWEHLDWAYMEHWVKELRLEDRYAVAKAAAECLEEKN